MLAKTRKGGVTKAHGNPILFSRRRVLAVGAAGLVSLTPIAAAAKLVKGERRLKVQNIHTGEALSEVYWQDGRYVSSALDTISYVLRDWRTDEVFRMETGVLDMLHELHQVMETTAPFDIISGYRSPATNAKLRAGSNGVAKKSLHMRGMAVDIALPGRDLAKLRAAAVSLKRGGVGYYQKSGFIHVDIGRVRYW